MADKSESSVTKTEISKPKSEKMEYYGIDEDDGVFVVIMMFGIFVAVVALGILYLIVRKEMGI